MRNRMRISLERFLAPFFDFLYEKFSLGIQDSITLVRTPFNLRSFKVHLQIFFKKLVEQWIYSPSRPILAFLVRKIGLPGQDLTFVNFSGARLHDSVFENANMARSWFVKTEFTDSDFTKSILPGVDFTKAIFNNYEDRGLQNPAKFDYADLRGLRIKGVNFLDTTFVKCNLKATILISCTFELTTIENPVVSGVCYGFKFI